VHVPGLDVGALEAFASENRIGGLILMGDNVPDPAADLASMTSGMSAEPGLPLLLGIDQEGGIVRRIDTDTAASAEELRFLDPDASRDAFATRGALLQSLGVSINFGIVADVTGDPDSFIYERSLGSTAADAAARVAAAVEGERGTVLSTLKHFPGHGVSPGDSHSSIPTTQISLDEWRVDHEPPFAAGIDAGAEVVMFGHLQFDAVDPQPASLSPMWHDLLRTELGFEGLIITDDMSMLQNSGRDDLVDPYQNAVRAVAAGNTMLLYVGPVDVPGVVAEVRDAVQAGTIDEALIDDAAWRILAARRVESGQTGPFVHCFEQCQSIIE
ncbi:MAG TPA: glycoside hydrolase family 3 N-terminal domain-containing protein, partial [Rhodoglobus sp.]|nr:glycoside hydrolase family 3 N-terminal domain-containing protein [Rhodoglobus sp.]